MATAIIGAGTTLFSAEQTKKAQDKAAGQLAEASQASINFLLQQGAAGERQIREAAERATERAGAIPGAARAPLQEFADIGGRAFGQVRRDILSGRQKSQDLVGQRVSQAALSAVQNQPGFNLSGPVLGELQRQASLTGQATQPGIQQRVLGIGGQGAAAAGDIAGILQRAGARTGDIAAQSAAQRASAIIGQAPAIGQQIQAGQEARLLSDIAGQQFQTTTAEQLARLAGRVV